jgi:hypothetical protein
MKKMRIYVPGLLSLLLLFPLLLYKLSHWGIFDREHAMEVTWYSPAIDNLYIQKFPPSKNYIDINLTGNATDEVKIEYAKVLLVKMVSLLDTTMRVHIIFADTAKYESLIEILNFCSQHDNLAYALYESNFWIFTRFENEEQKENMWSGSCTDMRPLEDPEAKHNFAWARFWPIGLLFILLVVFNFRRRLGAGIANENLFR